MLYDAKGNWRSEALGVCDDIRAVLRPLLEQAIREDMSHADFCYMVITELDALILYDRRHRKGVIANDS